MTYSHKCKLKAIIITAIIAIPCISIGTYLAMKPNNPILKGAKTEVSQLRSQDDKSSDGAYQNQILAQNISSINNEYANHWGIQKISFNHKVNDLIITIRPPKDGREANYLNSNVPITKRTEKALEVGAVIGKQYHVSNLQTRVHEEHIK